jgi:dicarboxylate transporter 10
MQSAKSEGRPAVAPSTTMMEKRDGDKAIASSTVRPRPVHYPFWFGGSASSMAACVTHPLDLGKSKQAHSPECKDS